MKRFWTDVSVVAETGGHAIRLDARLVRTPGRRPLLLPKPALAAAVAGEWRAVADTVDPRALPLTGLANAALDIVAPDPAAFAAMLARYGESDLLCYRADGPESLVAAEANAWDPVLDWAAGRYDIAFHTTAGIVHRAQPPATIDRLSSAIAARPPFRLAALSPLVSIAGSLIVALALDEDAIDSDAAFAAVTLDEIWQENRWGEDALATQTRAARRAEWDDATRFLSLLD